MGIFKAILGGLGFKQEGEQESPRKKYKQQNVQQQMEQVESIPENVKAEDDKNVNISSLICYAPKSNQDVKQLIEYLLQNKPCIVNLGELSQEDRKSVLDYLGGALYAIRGTISRLQDNLYVLSPKDVKINAM